MIGLVPPVDAILDLAGSRSGIAVGLALLVGSVGNLIAKVVVTAVVAAALNDAGSGRPVSVRSALRQTSTRAVALTQTYLRATITVVALSATVVGIPWGIRQAVRYTSWRCRCPSRQRHTASCTESGSQPLTRAGLRRNRSMVAAEDRRQDRVYTHEVPSDAVTRPMSLPHHSGNRMGSAGVTPV